MKKILILSLMLIVLVGLVSATEVDVNMDVDSGMVNIDVDSMLGTDNEATSRFQGIGGFEGNFNSNDNNVDNLLNTLVSAKTTGTTLRSRFDFESSHNLGTRNSNDNKMLLSTWVEGETANMDLYLGNSLDQSQANRVGGKPMLYAEDTTGFWMGYNMVNTKRDDSYTNAVIDVTLEGAGTGLLGKTIYGSNHLARGVGYNTNALDVRDGEVVATGTGKFVQTGMGDNSLEMNGFTFGSGWGQFEANYVGGFGGQYSVKAK